VLLLYSNKKLSVAPGCFVLLPKAAASLEEYARHRNCKLKRWGREEHHDLVLAQALDAMGATVTIIDADPNRPILRWRSGQSASTVELWETSRKAVLSGSSASTVPCASSFLWTWKEQQIDRFTRHHQADLYWFRCRPVPLIRTRQDVPSALIKEEEEALDGRTISFGSS